MKKNAKTALLLTTTTNQAGQPTAQIFLKVPEFSARYKIKDRTVWRWLKSGMPHLSLSRFQTRIPQAEADQWVFQHFSRRRTRVV